MAADLLGMTGCSRAGKMVFMRTTFSLVLQYGIYSLILFVTGGRWAGEIKMNPISTIKLISALIVGLTLSACATGNLADDLYAPNFGMRALNSEDNVDSRLLMNGLYSPKPFGVSPYAAAPYAPSCLTAEFHCSQQSQSAWSSHDP